MSYNVLRRAAPSNQPPNYALAGRSGPIVRNHIGPEQQCKALENIPHFTCLQNPDAVDEPGPIDSSDVGDVYDTSPWKSRLTST